MTADPLEDGDQLLRRVLAGADDEAANRLLNAFFSGYPIERLRLLVRDDSDEAVKAGAWIASELGAEAAPLMLEIQDLLRHPLKYVRFFACDAVLAAATTANGESIALAVGLIQDSEEAVRWKALNFLARASGSQLAASLQFLRDPSIAARAHWLVTAATEPEEVAARFAGDHLDRMFAVAGAVRLGRGGRSLLELAIQTGDPEVESFAGEALQAMSD